MTVIDVRKMIEVTGDVSHDTISSEDTRLML